MEESFLEALRTGDDDRVRELLSEAPGLAQARTANGVSAVLLAVYYGRRSLADLLLEKIPAPDIFEAAATGRSSRVSAILMEQPNQANAFSPDGFAPLALAAFFGYETAVQHLLSYGADANQPSHNAQQVCPLHSAAASRQIAIAKRLLAACANPNARQQGGFAPLGGRGREWRPGVGSPAAATWGGSGLYQR